MTEKPIGRLANRRLRPLGHLTLRPFDSAQVALSNAKGDSLRLFRASRDRRVYLMQGLARIKPGR